jgi:TolB protein
MLFRLLFLLVLASPAAAQLRIDITSGVEAPMPIAVPAFPTGAVAPTPAGTTADLGRQVAAIISANLAGSGLFKPVNAAALPPFAMADVSRPPFAAVRTVAAQALVTGFVTANPDGTLTIGCTLHDVFSEEQLAGQGFTVTPAGWRRAAHKCSDLVYARLTGESG